MESSKPLVSVVIAVYNSEQYIKRAIDSILNQTYTNIEIIIVDDGSTDATVSILNEYNNYDNIHILQNKNNLGISKSRNIGGKKAKGKYIAVQDADDVSLPERIKKQVDFLENRKDVVLLGARQINITINKKSLGKYFDEKEINKRVWIYNPIAHTSAIFPRDIYLKAGEYNESFIATVDYELYIRLLEFGKIAMLDEPLVQYYVHNNSITAKKRFRQCINSAKVRFRNIDKIGIVNFIKGTLYRCTVSYLPKWIVELKIRNFK